MRKISGHHFCSVVGLTSNKHELLQSGRCLQDPVLLSSMLQVVAGEVWDRVRLKSDIGVAVSPRVFLHLQSPMDSWLACC